MKTELRIIVMLLFCAALSGCASQRGMQLHPATDVCTVIVHSAGRLKRAVSKGLSLCGVTVGTVGGAGTLMRRDGRG